MESPCGGEGEECDGVKVAMGLKVNRVDHLERNESGRVTLSMDVGLVTWNVRVVDDGRVVNNGVEHWRGGKVGGVGLGHAGRGFGRRHSPVISEVYALGEAQPLLHRF